MNIEEQDFILRYDDIKRCQGRSSCGKMFGRKKSSACLGRLGRQYLCGMMDTILA